MSIITIIKTNKIMMNGSYSTHRGDENAYKRLVCKPERKRPLGRSRSRWEDNVKMYLKKYVWRVWTVFIWLRIW
jgi:hypothetical protein